MNCRSCGAPVSLPLLDLGTMPLANGLVDADVAPGTEPRYPLCVRVCTRCWLAQTDGGPAPELLFPANYPYLSGYSVTWREHARRYAHQMIARLGLGPSHRVIELATNDGSLLAEFAVRGIQCLGVEPAFVPAQAARERGLPIVEAFFGPDLAVALRDGDGGADLVVANNVLGHVPDPVGFARGVAILLRDHGVATFEFPALQCLVDGQQFDTVYHEHHSYFSLISVTHVLSQAGLRVFDLERLSVHGGSLRLYTERQSGPGRSVASAVADLLDCEQAAGVASPDWYGRLQPAADRVRRELLAFLHQARARGQVVGGYGAAAKGTTLLNWAGVGVGLLPWVVDRNPVKQGRLLPGCRIPVVAEQVLADAPPEYLLVLPWNLRREVIEQLARGGLTTILPVTAIPEVTIG